MAEKCALCRKPGTSKNPLNSHHYRSKKHAPHLTMRVHTFTCHRFADWITSLYIERGIVDVLEPEHLIYYFTRVAAVREEGVFVLPIY